MVKSDSELFWSSVSIAFGAVFGVFAAGGVVAVGYLVWLWGMS